MPNSRIGRYGVEIWGRECEGKEIGGRRNRREVGKTVREERKSEREERTKKKRKTSWG